MSISKPLRVLVIEDVEDDTLLLLHELKRSGYEVESERVETAKTMQAALAQKTWDLIISDYSLPEFNAPQALEVLKASGLDLPLILISGTIGEEAAAAAMLAGANDFLIKGKYARLGPAIERELREAESRRQRRLAEAATAAFQKRFQSLIEHAPDGVALLGIDGKLRQVTPSTEKILGYTLEEAEGQNPASFIHPDDLPGVMALLNDLIQDPGKIIHTQYRFKHKDGSWRWLENTISNLIAEPSVEAIVFNYRDVTEHKQALENLLASEVRYRRLFEAAKDGILILNAETGEIVDVNPFLIEMLGYDHTDFLGKQLWEIGLFKDIVANKEAFLKLQEERYIRYENLPLETKAGHRIWVEFVSNAYAVGNQQVIQCNIRDISERKKARKLVQQQLNRLNGLRTIDIAISSSFNIHVILDVLLQQVLSQLGVDAASILLLDNTSQNLEHVAGRGFRTPSINQSNIPIGKGYAGIVGSERKTIHIPNLIAADSQFIRAELLQEEGFVDYYGTPLITKGEVKGVLEVFHRSALNPDPEWLDFLETLARQAAVAIDNAQLFEDLQRSNAELEQRVALRTEELHRTNLELEHASRTKGEFLANMSHELRTPLNSILGFSETLLEKRRGPLTEKQEQYIGLIYSSGEHLLSLINDVLEVSKIEAGKLDVRPDFISVKEVCESSLNFIMTSSMKKSVSVEYINKQLISTVYADPQRLKQILVNLLNNAVKFTPENGKVTLEVYANTERDQIQFSVIDTGIGIDYEDLKKLFTPFTQLDSSLSRQHEGTGLGLMIVYKLTELHGGSVQVESEPGMGSRFTVILPWNEHEIKNHDQGTKTMVPPIAMDKFTSDSDDQGVILLAEDNTANVLTIQEYLAYRGYEVVVAHNGLEAIASAEEVSPRIILMDIQMPQMDGLEAIRHLRATPKFASVPIIALTALAMPGDRERCLEAGANEYLSKPVSMKSLVKTIDNLLQNKNR